MLTNQDSRQPSPSSSLAPSLSSYPGHLAEESVLKIDCPWTAELMAVGEPPSTSAGHFTVVPRLGKAAEPTNTTPLPGLKTRSPKKSSLRTAVQEDVNLIDGFVHVPPSFAFPQILIDEQMGVDSSRNRNKKLRPCNSKRTPFYRSTSWSIASSMTLLSNFSAPATANDYRRPSLPALDKLMAGSSRKTPSPAGNSHTLLPALPPLESASTGGSNANPLTSKRLTSSRNTGAPSRRIPSAGLPSELNSQPTTTCTLDPVSIPVQKPSGARAALVSTSTRTTDSAGDVYASADSSLLHFGPAPPLPPRANVGTSKSDGTASPGVKPRGRLPAPRLASRGSVDSASLSPSSIGIDCLAAAHPPSPDTRTLASLYMVCGLPKDPQCWTLAQPEALPAHLDGAVPRFWRPEVLGTTISGQDADLLGGDLEKRRPSSSRKNSSATARRNSHSISSQSPENGLGKEELARVQAKAMKLAFAREVEVIASTIQPSSTTHCFSFVVPPQASAVTDATGAIGQHWDLSVAGANGGHTSGRPKTYYGACLQVWSHADRARSEAIRRAVEEGSKAKSAAIARAVKAAAAGKRLGARLERASKSAMGAIPLPEGLGSKNWAVYTSTGGETDTDTEGFCSESEWDGPASLLPVANLPGGTPFWLPYCLVLISRIPIYDIMADHLRISWARYHQAIGKHSQQMLKMLNFPCPKPGEAIKLPVGGSQQSSSSANFVAKIPGKTNLMNGGLEDVDFTMWPVFKSLSLSHLVSIYELALSPMGRAVFFSRYPAMLNMAVETFRVLLELRGWQGLCQSIVHARDVKIYLEDPGPFLLGMNSQLRPIVASGAPPEIMIVDIDTDNVICQRPHPQAFSKGRERLKIIRRLEEVLGTLGGIRGVPSEFHEAFPGGRFRPFSAVEIKDMPSEAERLLPPAEWNWDQTKAIMAFDLILSKVPRRGLAKVFKRKSYRQAAQLDSSAQHVQEIVRKHTAGFVDRRDMLETKIWKLNRRLAFLMAESMEWKQHFDVFQKFADKLSVESQDLKTRLEVERRDHRQLSGVVSEQKQKQAELEARLLETEQAWMVAQVELAKAQDIREELERQKQIMVSEMKSIALGDDDESIVEKIMPRVENRYLPSRAGTPMSDHGSLTTRNLQRFSVQVESSRISPRSPTGAVELPSTGAVHSHAGVSPGSTGRGSPLSIGRASPQSLLKKSTMDGRRASLIRGFRSPLDELSEFDTDSEATSGLSGMDERARLSRTAVIETMRSIQGRLEAALRTAGQLDEDELKSYDVSGSGRRTHSTMSAESRDSRIIPLQRGRRKPMNNEQERPRTSSTASPEQVELVAQQAESLGRADSIRPKGVSLLRGARNDPRMSAVSLLKPGSSIFGDRPSSSAGTDPNMSDNIKLETVIDGNELEEIEEHQCRGLPEELDQNQRTRDRRGARLRRQASSGSSSGRGATVVDLELRQYSFTPTNSTGEISYGLSPHIAYAHSQNDETEDGTSSIASTHDEEEGEEEEKFLSATEEDQEALGELENKARKTLGRLRKTRGSVSDISRVSMVGMRPPRSVTRHCMKEQNVDDESVSYRKSFMSYDSSSTVRNMAKLSGGGGGSSSNGWR